MKLTFILPTYNRKNYVLRAINSCLLINKISKKIKVKVLVMDGFSNDGAWELMKSTYFKSSDVILKQVPKHLGFQETAFIGLKYVKTDYCTFMYDDDVISNYFYRFAEKLKDSKQTFIIGYGKNFHVSRTYKFHAPNFIMARIQDIILNYFGFFNKLKYNSLPVSPVPSISKTSNLKLWKNQVRQFTNKSSFRKIFFLNKNIGPDLVILLFNLFLQKKNIFICNSTISQLSYHSSAMSIAYGKTPLSTGYWLARVWYFEYYLSNCKNIDKIFLSKISSYIIVSGFYVLILNFISLNFYYLKNILFEIFTVIKKNFQKKIVMKTIYFILEVILNRLKRNKMLYIPE